MKKWGYEDFVDIFGDHHKIGLVLEVISMYLGSFLTVNVQNDDIFGGCKKFKIFFFFLGGGGLLDFLDIF